MTVDMFKYSQVVWAYFILDAATLASTKYTDFPGKSASYEVQEEPSEIHPYYSRLNTTALLDQDIMPSQLGLFVAQPTKVQPLMDGPDPVGIGPDTRYGRNFGFIPLTKKRRGAEHERLSLFTKVNRNRFKDKHKYNDPDTRPLASDHYLTPEFVKFKNEIEREADKTHFKGLKMSKDNDHSPTIVYERPVMKYKEKRKPLYKNPMPLADDSYQKPSYEDPESYDDYSTYPKSGSYSSHFSSSNDYPYPKSNSYSSQSTVPSEPYLPPGFDSSDFTFPPYPPLPEIEPDSYNPPHSESEARNPPFGSFKQYRDPLSDEPPSYHFPKSKVSPLYPKNEESDSETQLPVAGDTYYKPRKYFGSDDYRSELPSRKEKPFRYRPKPSRIGRPYGKPAQVSIQVSRNEDDEEDFDSNFETPSASDSFLNDDEAEEEEEEEEKPPPLLPKGRLRQPSRKEHKRVRPDSSRKKRCVKKRKEMSVDEPEDEPGREMSCLVCENLDTGGTYETCSYESDPDKNSYLIGNEASYRQGGPKGLSKHRYKRHAVVINRNEPPRRRVARRTYEETGSYAADSDDYDLGNFEDEEDDDMAEFKPQPPAYANDESCTEVKKGNSICMVCQNPESNGKYEQCSYANDPGEDSYEYAQSSRYGSGTKSEAPSKKHKGRHRRMSHKKLTADKGVRLTSRNVTNQDNNTAVKENAITNVTVNAPEANTNKSAQADDKQDMWLPLEWQGLRDVEQKKIESVNKMFHDLVRTKKEQPNSRFLADVEDSSYEEQFLNLFPELGGSSSTEFKRSLLNDFDEKPILGKEKHVPGFKTKSKLGSYFSKSPRKSILDGSGEETEMSKMMKEFANKDRSACTKRMKDKMTCYVCDDSDGIKREECMYVVENEPKKVSYQESKHTNSPGGKTAKREISKKPKVNNKYIRPNEMEPSATLVDTREHEISKNPKSYSNLQIHTQKSYSAEGSPFERYSRHVPGDSEVRDSNRRKRYKKEEENDDEEETVSEDPEETGEYQSEDVTLEADPTSPDGAFSDDVKPMFDKELKISLPKFMVEKSEHEEMIDDFMKNLERR